MLLRISVGVMIAAGLLFFACPFSILPMATGPELETSTAVPTLALETPVGIKPDDQWIEVDLQAQKVRLHDGSQVVGEFEASSGVGISPETTTYPGLFWIQEMIKGPLENVPGVFLTDVLIFDWAHGNGIHSVPMDAEGNVLDSRLGEPLTAGCIRVAHSDIVYDFARLMMYVWVH